MLIIKFPRFTNDFIKNSVYGWADNGWEAIFGEALESSGCPLDIEINEKRITLPDDLPYSGYMVSDTLKNINNSFCLALLRGQATATLNRPDYLKMKIVGDKILFTNEKIEGAVANGATWSSPDNSSTTCTTVLQSNGSSFYFNDDKFSFEKK